MRHSFAKLKTLWDTREQFTREAALKDIKLELSQACPTWGQGDTLVSADNIEALFKKTNTTENLFGYVGFLSILSGILLTGFLLSAKLFLWAPAAMIFFAAGGAFLIKQAEKLSVFKRKLLDFKNRYHAAGELKGKQKEKITAKIDYLLNISLAEPDERDLLLSIKQDIHLHTIFFAKDIKKCLKKCTRKEVGYRMTELANTKTGQPVSENEQTKTDPVLLVAERQSVKISTRH